MSKYTAIGIRYSDDGCAMSTGIAEDIAHKPQLVSNALCDEFDCGFEEIIVMANGKEGPVVVANYTLGKHYQEGEWADNCTCSPFGAPFPPSSHAWQCCICEKFDTGWGNNPAPVSDGLRCCDYCNRTVVIPERLRIAGISIGRGE